MVWRRASLGLNIANVSLTRAAGVASPVAVETGTEVARNASGSGQRRAMMSFTGTASRMLSLRQVS